MYFVYILRCEDNSLYTGYTTNVKRRFAEHCSSGGKGAKYTHSHRPIRVESVWKCTSRSSAMKLEAFIKRLNKAQKEELIFDNTLLSRLCGDKLKIDDYNRSDDISYENQES